MSLDPNTIIRNPIDWNLIKIREYPVHKMRLSIDRAVYGFDTETLDGYCKLIACDNGDYRLDSDIDGILKFLTQKKYRVSSNFFFNLNYDVNAILKFLDRKRLEELRADLQTYYQEYKIFYIPRKMFRITKNKRVYAYFDIAQFFSGSLESSGKKYLGLEKYQDDYGDIDGETLGTSSEYWNKNLEKIIRYCINDCKITQGLGSLLAQTLNQAIGLKPNKYTSKASITKEYIQKSVDIPCILNVPKSALRYAFNSYSGGRFEVIKKGYTGLCSLYDINSAYPYHIQNLPDITLGEWRRVRSLHEEAELGFYLVRLRTKYQKITPIPFSLGTGAISYPVFNSGLYITKDELLAYDSAIDYEIISGWEFYPDKLEYPFREYIEKVYAHKNKADKDSYEYSLFKILMNSLYGCFYEKFVDTDAQGDTVVLTGKLFNPVYATMITALTRIQLYEYSKHNFADVVGYATDSVLFQGDPELSTSDKLGEWSKEAYGKTTILRSGVYKIDNKLKNRGIKKAHSLKTPYGKFPDVFNYIQSRPFETEYPIIMTRPLTFIEVLLKNKQFDLPDINSFTELEYVIDINKDHKRRWLDDFESGGELFKKSIESRPLVLN